MKIAFITYEYPPSIMGGAGVYAERTTEELAKLGHQITVFTPDIYDNGNEIPKDNLKIIRIPINKRLPFKAMQFWLKLPKEVKNIEMKEKFDIVHINGNSYFSFRKKISKAPHVVMVHHSVMDTIKTNKMNFISRILNIGAEDSFIMPLIEKKVINLAQKIVVPSYFTKNSIINHYKIDSSIIEVIYEGMTFKNYSKSMDNNTINNGIGKNLILFVGRVDDPRKGLDILLRIFKKVLFELDCQLLIVGSGNPENALSLAKSLDILDKIFFAGQVDNNTLYKYYNLCDVYVCPSKLEGFGLTILEAISVGKPVVAFKVGSIPELIENYYNGILIERNDIDNFATAICYLLKNGKLKWTTEERINYIKENFSWENSAKQLENLYTNMVFK